ncbi:hypothetical protein Tco_1043387 [Tanacetum coccineum]|uniref:Retrotransposon gag domain-containing protein n=1 Tax=Tanacetum coccineum TaxID=301880 RepID=A0ABQ5GNX6_9ASTR
MPAQTRSGISLVLEDSNMTAMRESLLVSMRDEMERFWQAKSNSQNENSNGDAILKRFSLAYDDPLAEIKKLKQTGSVQQYIDAYDKLLCRVKLQDKQAMSFFIAGLQSEIELAVRMFKPTSLAELYGLCKLQESQLNVGKQKGKMPLLTTPRLKEILYGLKRAPRQWYLKFDSFMQKDKDEENKSSNVAKNQC